ncbi:MAG: CHASE2 domain-containing protein [Mariprofundaceae bacterium]|nr:CHASE2 domain-containing protein [Mariprofundaceae bacterium]
MTFFHVLMRRYPAVSIAILIIMSTWLCSRVGLLQLFDGYLYDMASTYSIETEHDSPVLMIEAFTGSQTMYEEKGWLLFLERLEAMGAKQIIFTFIPEHASEAFFEKAGASSHVFFGQQLLSSAMNVSEKILEPLSGHLDLLKHHIGIVSIPESQLGVYRTQQTEIEVKGVAYPVLESLVASNIRDLSDLDHSTYHINFTMRSYQLPKIRFKRVLEGGLIAEMVTGKSVLVGLSDQRAMVGLHTPISHHEETLSLLEYQSFALHTLLTDQVIVFTSESYLFVLLCVLVILVLILYQWLDHAMIGMFTFSMIVAYLGLAWFLLSYQHVWIPVSEMIAAQLLILFGLARYQNTIKEKEMKYLLLKTSSKLTNEFASKNFYSSDEHWVQIINMVNQTLDLNRIIFLERVTGDHRVHEVASLHCHLDDLAEPRRDYERTPYSTAIAENGPLRVEKPYFKNIEEGEVQFLTPLIFAGDVMGFWAFGVGEKSMQQTPSFYRLVKNYAQQIAELLYHREKYQSSERAGRRVVSQYMNLEVGNSLFSSLKSTLLLMEKKLLTLEQVLHGLDESVMMYDLFGHVMQVNKNTETIFQDTSINLFEQSALSMLMATTGMTLAEAQRTLRHVILDHQSVHLKADALQGIAPNMMISIHALINEGNEHQAQVSSSPQDEVKGMIFEFHDEQKEENLNKLKWHLAMHTNQHVLKQAKDMHTILKTSDAEQRHGFHHARHIAKMVFATQKMLRVDENEKSVLSFPIDSNLCLQDALARLSRHVEDKDIALNVHVSDLNLVFSESEQLKKLFSYLFRLFLDDAVENSQLSIKASHHDGGVLYECHNQGFGIPNDRLQAYLYGEELPETDQYRLLRRYVSYVSLWEGKIDVQSQVGKGFKVKIWLRQFAC